MEKPSKEIEPQEKPDETSSQQNDSKQVSSESDWRTDEHKSRCPYRNFLESSEDNDGENRNLAEEKKLSMLAVFVTIMKAIIGTGIINLPFIVKSLGLYFSLFSIVMAMIVSTNSVYFLMRSKIYTHKYSYAIYAKMMLGTTGSIVLKIIFILKNIFSCCVRLRVFGNLSQQMVLMFLKLSGKIPMEMDTEPTQLYLKKNFFIMCVFFILMPLIFKNDLSALKKFNFLGVFSAYFFVAVLFVVCSYKFFKGDLQTLDKTMLYPTITYSGVITSMAALFDAFSFHVNVFPIYLTMKNRTAQKMTKSTTLSMFVTALLYLITGLSGYSMFRDRLKKDVFSNFKDEIIFYRKKNIFISALLFFSLIGFFISALLSFPLVFFSLKNNLWNFFVFIKKVANKKHAKDKKNYEEDMGEELVEQGEKVDHVKDENKEDKKNDGQAFKKIIYPLLCYSGVCFLTLCVEQVITFNSIAGSTFGNVIYILAPALFLLYFSKKSLFSYEKLSAWFSTILSVLMFFWWLFNMIKK